MRAKKPLLSRIIQSTSLPLYEDIFFVIMNMTTHDRSPITLENVIPCYQSKEDILCIVNVVDHIIVFCLVQEIYVKIINNTKELKVDVVEV